jgi:transcriptional regulator with XRE-family HTH domain
LASSTWVEPTRSRRLGREVSMEINSTSDLHGTAALIRMSTGNVPSMPIPIPAGGLRFLVVAKSPEDVLLARLRGVRPGQQGIVAELTGISRNHLSRVVNGKVNFNPTLQSLKGIADALGLTLAQLFTDPDEVAETAVPYQVAPSAVIEASRLLAEAQELLTSSVGVAPRARGGVRRTGARKKRTRAAGAK